MNNQEIQFLVYTSEQEDISVETIAEDETIWLSQKGMAELFGVQPQTIAYHLKEVYESGELMGLETIRKIRIVRWEGNHSVARAIQCYNLDAIISVGYRVNSKRATQFRIWATKVLREFITKGFVLDDDRLKQGTTAFGQDYFQELLERVRSIRASERRIWQKITDIFAECSIDYDKNSDITRRFYATVQNKFHHAITGQTAAERIFSQSNAQEDHMGLKTWKNAPDGRILKSDVRVAKNYLMEDEIRQLERTVSGYFDYIESLIERKRTFKMEDFERSINKFLEFQEYDVLEGRGSVSAKVARAKAEREYDIFNRTQQIESDFDKEVEKMLNKCSK